MDNAVMSERKITVIKPMPKMPQMYKNVAIYSRVSTNHTAQEDSLKAQVDRFKKMVEDRCDWILVKTYSDVASGRNTTGRTEFTDLMNDCRAGKIDLIITKAISRFGRNTVDILSNIRELKNLNVDVFFEAENIYASESVSELMLSIISAVAQEDSASKSQNIRIGIEYQMKNGTSHIYSRPCYGYKKNDKGKLVIDDKQAENVKLIFDLYLQGHSVLSIIQQLKKRKIKSPSGNKVWPKRAIETLLRNEKYVGDVFVGKTYKAEFPSSERRIYNGGQGKYERKNSHEPIIQRDIFDKVQQIRSDRSNLQIDVGKVIRKTTHYSMKKSCNGECCLK